IAALFLTAMIIYKDTLTLEALILIFIGAGGTITAVWKWLNSKEEVKILKVMHKAEMQENRKLKSTLNTNVMTDQEAGVILAQAEYINDNIGATHPLKQVAQETVENLKSLIGGGGIRHGAPNN